MSETGRGQPKLLYDVASGSRSHEDLPNENEVDEHRGKTDLPFFDLSTIVAATDDFSSAKMLGHGGFGIVYKVLNFPEYFDHRSHSCDKFGICIITSM